MNRVLKLSFSAALLLITGVTYGQTTAKADNAIEEKIRSLISQMTLQEKVSLLHDVKVADLVFYDESKKSWNPEAANMSCN